MKLISKAVVIALVTCLVDSVDPNVRVQFKVDKIIPDVLSTQAAPKNSMTVKYSDGSQVLLGNKLTKAEVSSKPAEISYAADKNAYYTLLFIQANATAELKCPKRSQVIHWHVYNIKGNDTSKSGQTLIEYIAPAIEGYRYVFLAMKQKKELTNPTHDNVKTGDNQCFNSRTYIKRYISKVVAGCFFILDE